AEADSVRLWPPIISARWATGMCSQWTEGFEAGGTRDFRWRRDLKFLRFSLGGLMSNYAKPEALVSTDWVEAHAGDPSVRLVEVDVNTAAYDEGHIPGAIAWAWNSQLCDTVRRDILSPSAFEQLMLDSGIGNNTTVVLYGDNNNWFAAWAFWQMKIYGHKDVRLMNGGRKKWIAEARDLSSVTPKTTKTQYKAAKA